MLAFHEAASHVPAYSDLLCRRGVNPAAVITPSDFARAVPLVDKQSLFAGYSLSELCANNRLADAATLSLSSGYSGVFSFAAAGQAEEQTSARLLDEALDEWFHVRTRRTLLINALPAGVHVPATAVTTADVGARPHAAVTIAQRAGPSYEQLIIVAEHPMLKAIIEQGLAFGLDWPAFRVFLVTGAEVMPENFRIYAGNKLGHDPQRPEDGFVLVSLGVSELGLTLGQEWDDCRLIRRLAHGDPALRQTLFGPAPFVPTLVHNTPEVVYVETPADPAGRTRLVVTTLDPGRMIPLIRYSTGDWAEVIPAEAMADRLRAAGAGELADKLPPLPFLALWGRGRSARVGDRDVFPEQVKEAIYADPSVAAALTANFRMRSANDVLQVRFQLKPHAQPTSVLADPLARHLTHWTNVPAELTLVPYRAFAEGMELSYEHKFRYLDWAGE